MIVLKKFSTCLEMKISMNYQKVDYKFQKSNLKLIFISHTEMSHFYDSISFSQSKKNHTIKQIFYEMFQKYDT